jgi:preprotein translocase subunit SecA
VRLFAGDRIHNIMDRFKLPDDQPMESGILSRQIENAQKKVEEQNFVARKNVLKYDDVMNTQRQVIYEQRRRVLEGADLSEDIREVWLPAVIGGVVVQYTFDGAQGDWDMNGLVSAMEALYGTGVTADELRGLDPDAITQEFLDDALDAYKERDAELDQIQPGLMRDLERYIVLQVVDVRWREHLENMDYLREGIHLRGMAQKDPLVEYRNEGHEMFAALNDAIREEVVTLIFHAEIEADPNAAAAELQQPAANGSGNGALTYEHTSLAGAEAILAAGGSSGTATAALAGGGAVATGPAKPVVKSDLENIGRNDPCYCGSGKKYKKCHGA